MKKATLATYLAGFLLSVLLTFCAFGIVIYNLASKKNLAIPIVILALLQVVIQLRFFLHLGQEKKPKWHLWIFLSTVLIAATLVFGSLWIMHSLNYRMML